MKHTLALIVALVIFAGCGTPQRTAYKSLAVAAQSVDAGMKAYGDFYRAGRISADTEAKVHAAYDRYQSAMRVAHASVTVATSAPDSQKQYETALQAVEASSAELLAIIHSIK